MLLLSLANKSIGFVNLFGFVRHKPIFRSNPFLIFYGL